MRFDRAFVQQWLWTLPLFLLLLSALLFSPGLEIETDNLKYMGIAWSMQETGNYLVPFVNGVPYTDKPPLLFWMILVCWHIFGMNAVGLLCLLSLLLGVWIVLTKSTYAIIFPEDGIGRVLLPYVMISSFAVFGYAHFLHVDLFLVTGVLLANLGICKRLQGSFSRANTYIVLGIFIGLFAKGPVVYVFTLLPLLVSFFLNQRYRKQFLTITGLVIVGTLLFFIAWIIPIIFLASHEFLQQILYGQIADRAGYVDDKSHFFYLLKLPYLLLPWSLCIIFVRKFSSVVMEVWKRDLFILAIIVAGLLVLSFFGQKRFWYLLPCIPYCIMIITRFFVAQNKIGLMRFVKVAGLGIALFYMAISPYYFSLIENAFQLKLIKHVLREHKNKQEGVAFLLDGGSIYSFNYLAQMHTIPLLDGVSEMQQWLELHPRGVVIVHAKACPAPLHLVVSSHEMHYLLCQKA